jgi:hypothetical protein
MNRAFLVMATTRVVFWLLGHLDDPHSAEFGIYALACLVCGVCCLIVAYNDVRRWRASRTQGASNQRSVR